MHKEIDVVERSVDIEAVVQSVDTDIQEPVVDVAVLVDDQDIDVEDVHIVDIEMSEAFPFMTNGALNEHMDDKDVLLDGGIAVDKNDEWVLLQDLLEISAGSGTVSHPDLHGREMSNQHPISAIENLQKNLDDLGATERVYSSSNGLGEFRRWKDGNPEGEDRSGYFIAIVPGTDEIEICDATHDVYGISVHNSGFIGNQDDLYYKGKDLLNNNANDPSYAVVGIVGAMRVRTDGTARNGDYVVPNAYGEATLSENDYGYKVLSQGSYPSYNYVTIAITPQSDALSRLQSSVAGGDLGEILIKIENIDKGIGDLELKVDASVGDIEDILSEIGGLQQRVTTAEDVIQNAVEQAEEAKDMATQAASKAAQAQQDAQDAAAGAISSANQALSEVSNLAEQMEPIVSWQSEDGVSSGAGGFVSQANDDHTLLASIVYGSGPEGSSLAAIMQKVDENGAIIQHLVSHVDRYVVGENSLSDGLTHDEAKAILTEEYIYVPTSDHKETMAGEPEIVTAFKRGYYYVWDTDNSIWVKSTEEVSMATTYNDGNADGDLWYCWQDVIVEEDAYVAGTLYRWFGSEWVAVATIADNHQARILTSIKQTADEIEMSVVASEAEGSTLKQKLDSIFTTVYDTDGYISSLEQTAESIRAGTYTESGTASQLELLTSETNASLNAVVSGRFHVVYHSFLGVAPDVYDNGNKYTKPPVWDDNAGVFVFNDTYADANGTYYFTSEDQTKYCKVTDDGYDIYTIGNKATSMLDSRIGESEARLDAFAEFETETTETIGDLSIRANENEAQITTLTSYYYHTLLSVSENSVTAYGDDKYNKPPEWNIEEDKYVFDMADRDDSGQYYFADEDAQTYCRAVPTDTTTLYETYGLAGSNAAYILQKSDENSSSIGLVVKRTEKVIDKDGNLKDEAISSKGSIIIDAINGESTAKIDADRIVLTGEDEISLLVEKAKNHADKRVTIVASSQMFIKATDATEYTPKQITLTAKTSGEITSYEWYKDDELLSSAKSNSLTVLPADVPANSATYKVVCKDTDGEDADGNEYTDMISIAKLSDGKDGNNGQTYYTWVKYADSPTTGMSDEPEGKAYIGLAYNQTSQEESDEYEDYQWSLIKGADGIGVDGKTYYTWVKYADDASGTKMSDDPTGKKYIGLAYNKEASNESTNASDYTWALFKGSDGIAGEDGYTVVLSNEFIEVPVTSERKPKASSEYTCQVDVYKGLTALTPTTGTLSASQFKVDIDSAPTGVAVSQSNAGTLEIRFDSQKVISDSSDIQLEITVHSGIVLGTKIVIRANMNDVTVDQVASMAEIKETVDDQGASIEMVVATNKDGNKQVRGGILITAINGESNAQIDAERVNIAASKMFEAVVDDDGTITPASIVLAINGSDSDVKIGANHVEINADSIDLSANKMFSAVVDENGTITPASIMLSINNDSESDVRISADRINLDGYVTISDLSTAGKTTIDGSNITTGALQSANYSYISGTYSTAGTKIDLTNGAITSKNFAIDSSGIIYANAANLTSASIAYASLLSCVINNMLIIAGTSNQPISYLTNGSMSGLPLLNVNQDQFTITSDGFVTVKNGLNLISTGSSSTDRTALAFTVPSPYYANQYIQLSHIDAYYNTSNSRYETRWTTDFSDVIKIHSKSGGLSIDAGPNQQLHIGTTTDNNTYGQLVYINSQQTNSATTIYGTNITIGAYGTNRIDLVGDVYLNNTLLTSGGSGGVALFG